MDVYLYEDSTRNRSNVSLPRYREHSLVPRFIRRRFQLDRCIRADFVVRPFARLSYQAPYPLSVRSFAFSLDC